jgi:hypothetical protein
MAEEKLSRKRSEKNDKIVRNPSISTWIQRFCLCNIVTIALVVMLLLATLHIMGESARTNQGPDGRNNQNVMSKPQENQIRQQKHGDRSRTGNTFSSYSYTSFTHMEMDLTGKDTWLAVVEVFFRVWLQTMDQMKQMVEMVIRQQKKLNSGESIANKETTSKEEL